MFMVMAWWVLAMVSALSWAKAYTTALTAATLAVFLWQHHAASLQWTGLLQLAAFGVTPLLLSAQRERDQRDLKRLHAEEAVALTHLSAAARSLMSLQAATQQLDAQITRITDLYHVTKQTVRALHLEELFLASLDVAPRLLDAQGLRLIDLTGADPCVLRATRSSEGRMAQAAEGHKLIDLEHAVIQRVRASGHSGSATAQELACRFPDGLSRVSWAPLGRSGSASLAGILMADELPEAQADTLPVIANQLSLQLARVSLYQQVETMAVHDALTGLFVRGYFLERAREELARSARHGASCTLLMADLDRFKEKNDTFGHLVGDVVLKEVAQLLQRNLREVDMMARFGGEEFIFMLIEADLEHARPIAERLRQLVEVHPIRAYDELLSQTISIGMAEFPKHGRTLETLIECADQALYAAKQAGRNRVVAYSEKLASTPT